MSLTGNLEDLPLLDIIQIVSFSKKTGYLTIRQDSGDAAAIVFHDGFVVSSFTWDTPALEPQLATAPPPKREAIIRKRIEMALEQLIRLREGQFSFSLTDEKPKTIGHRDIVPETLAHGINPQELLLDLARGIDEDRRDSSAALEASFAEAPAEGFDAPAPAPAEEAEALAPLPEEPAPEAAPEPVPEAAPQPPSLKAILLVDDEEDVRRVLADRFSEAGYDVMEAEDPESAVKKAGRMAKGGLSFMLVTDLGMPTSGGSSFQGGFEVVKRLWKMNIQPPVLLMTDSLGSSVQARAKQMGISHFVFKPGLSKLDPKQFEADLRAFASKVASDVLPRLARSGGAAPQVPEKEAAPVRGAAKKPAATAEELSREFQILQKHLAELRRSLEPTQVSMLVMKVAREFFERSIIFLVKNEEVRGLGGFGPAPREESLNLLVRDVVIPLSEPSVFLDVVNGRKPWYGSAEDGKWPKYLLGKIGRFKAGGAAVLPLLTHRETIALVYGDNPETGRAFGRLEALEVFMTQAGVAMENAFLQRKLQTMQKE